MIAARFDEVFLIPARRVKQRADVRPQNGTSAELEFSSYARYPRQGLALVLLGVACFWLAVIAIVTIAA